MNLFKLDGLNFTDSSRKSIRDPFTFLTESIFTYQLKWYCIGYIEMYCEFDLPEMKETNRLDMIIDLIIFFVDFIYYEWNIKNGGRDVIKMFIIYNSNIYFA